MKIKSITERISDQPEKFCDLTTGTGNFVLANGNLVIHNSHISVLLMTVFLKLLPKVIDMGVVYRAELPLYGAIVGKQFVPIYNDQQLDTFKQTHPKLKIQRYKGLGEMNPDQLKVCLLDKGRILTRISLPKDPCTIFKLMTDPQLKRKLV